MGAFGMLGICLLVARVIRLTWLAGWLAGWAGTAGLRSEIPLPYNCKILNGMCNHTHTHTHTHTV